ncbi:CHAT domain-containing protein [Calothrix sp. PCC 6303]|uniref:CHAT domain-containing protein n=1 Tax=Calothrix sp. PCC 6303 TaxID=1170562 RepID=UPI0002F31A13|nr:CHAT domain-containing protein [Calothrix sp. PCC 6303]
MKKFSTSHLRISYRRFTKYALPMLVTALLCITSPGFAKISDIPQTATPIVENQSSSSLEQQARSLYNQGQYNEAATLFQQAAQQYQQKKDPVRQALSLSNLSLCQQQLGNWNDAESTITESIKLLDTNKSQKPEYTSALVQTLDIQGRLQLSRGKPEIALKTWERVTAIYTQQKQPQLVLTSKIKQAQALQSLGLYRRAADFLAKTFNLPLDVNTDVVAEPGKLKLALRVIPVSAENATGLYILGDSLRVIGEFKAAKIILEHSLAIAQKLEIPKTIALNNLSLGNLSRAQINFDEILDDGTLAPINFKPTATLYQNLAEFPTTPANIRIQARLNQLGLLIDSNQLESAKELLPQLQTEVDALPSSIVSIDARVNLAQSTMRIYRKDKTLTSLPNVAKILALGAKQAKELGNPRTESYVLGTMGSIYEETGQWAESEKLTQQAMQLSQQINAEDITYLWQWQLGRVTKEQGKNENAIAAYREAVNTIKSLRADLATASPDVQFSFRDAVEPIHRQLVRLLVESKQKDNLKTARDIIEGLQLVELDNFFREACLNADPKQVDQVDEKAGVIYPIILEDQLAVIVSLPKLPTSSKSGEKREFRYYKTDIKADAVNKLAADVRGGLNQANALDLILPDLQKMYDLIIRPAAPELAASKVETLVLVLDGSLRSIPISALHDGEKYLIEKYSIALTPGLQLLAPRSPKQEKLGALVGGLSASRLNFSSLPSVIKEVKQIESEIPSKILLNDKFTKAAFQAQVASAPFPVVHLATHAQFSSQAEKTFILTWDEKINVKDLSSVLQTVELSRSKSLELLVLSACQTASGDARSALGLAGVAVRSGARSTIATLWRVNDEASATLMSKFYEELSESRKSRVSKAEALRRAQLSVLNDPKYKSPYYWGAYVLLGNWV